MNKQEIITKLQEIIPTDLLNMPGKKIENNEPLISSGLIDSFSLVDLAILVEDEFDVRIEDTELNSDSFDTLDQLADLILKKVK